MNELTFISSIFFIVPAAYIVQKFYHLHKGINQYTHQLNNLQVNPASEVERNSLQPNLTLVRCQKCSTPDSDIKLPKVVSHQ